MAVDPALPPSLARVLQDLERRLANLERSARLPFSSTRGGAFLALDPDGNRRFALGEFEAGGEFGINVGYGVVTYGDDERILSWAALGSRGQVYPFYQLNFHVPTPVTVTSSTYVTLWETQVVRPVADVLLVGGRITTDAGTTGEVRILESGSGQVTDPVVAPGGTFQAFWAFEWEHPATTGLRDPRTRPPQLVLQIQARRASGTGNVMVAPPLYEILGPKVAAQTASPNGNPRLL